LYRAACLPISCQVLNYIEERESIHPAGSIDVTEMVESKPRMKKQQ
jgi:hypothetical protein